MFISFNFSINALCQRLILKESHGCHMDIKLPHAESPLTREMTCFQSSGTEGDIIILEYLRHVYTPSKKMLSSHKSHNVPNFYFPSLTCQSFPCSLGTNSNFSELISRLRHTHPSLIWLLQAPNLNETNCCGTRSK